ncbi:GNAT family N-acetyltransferase [bacterium]|nr:GNAT family N-acetyltransferase [bacterium]
MKIESNNNTAFGAKFIKFEKIKKLKTAEKTYENIYASFVEINPQNQNDISALSKTAKYWENEKFAGNIYLTAKELTKQTKNIGKIYALTEQKGNFEKLEFKKILGITNIIKEDTKCIYLDHIQTNPAYIYDVMNKFKGIGSGILNSLKSLYNVITLISLDTKATKNFYRKNGFQEVNNSNLFVWYK